MTKELRFNILPQLLIATTATLCFVCASTQAKVSPDAPPSLIALDSASQAGNAEAMYRMARATERGYPPYLSKDSIEAVRLYMAAADKEYAPAMTLAGYIYYDPSNPQRDITKALHLTEKAAMLGDAKAANNLGWMLTEGDGVVHDAAKAAYWFGKGAEAGLPSAQSQLADLYKTGRGLPPDTLRAIALYDAAIRGGLADAQLKLLQMMMPQWTSLPDSVALSKARHYISLDAYVVAVPLLEVAAKSSNADALALLGFAYSRGLGVEYSHPLSIEYFFRAANEGNPSAQFIIGELLEIFPDALRELHAGLDVTDNMHIPAYWYDRAALQGITDSRMAAEALTGKIAHHHPDNR